MLAKIARVSVPALVLIIVTLTGYWVALVSGIETLKPIFLLGYPFIAGVVMMYFRPEGEFSRREFLQKPSSFTWIFWLWGLMLACIFLSLVLGIEGIICVAMAIVPILIATMVGGLIYLLILRWRAEAKRGAIHFITVPLIALFAIGYIQPGPTIYTISDSTLIKTSPEKLFAQIQAIPEISADEIPTRPSHYLGIPKPTEAVWTEDDKGVLRISHWGDTVQFHERITKFEESKRIEWSFEFPEGWADEGVEDPHIEVGGEYFDVLSGGYTLEPMGDHTKLTLTTRTFDGSGLGAYAKFWHHFFFRDFHVSVLALVKNRAEAS